MNQKNVKMTSFDFKILPHKNFIRAISGLFTVGLILSIPSTPIAVELTPAQQVTPLEGKQKIILLGDSITQAGGNYGGYVWLMQQYLNTLYPQSKIQLIQAGVSGQTSGDLQVRFQQDVLEKQPDLVTINVGVNDIIKSLKNSSTEQQNTQNIEVYRQNLTAMVQAAQSRNISVLLLSPTIITEDLNSRENIRLREYIAVMREVSAQNRCKFLDLNLPFRDVILTYQRYGGQAQNILTRDGIHPNLAGHQILAYTILRSWGIPEQQIQKLQVIE
ncbi:SGNH/GDSL hydrolase family protein [Limnoraphis robusta]|nr:SGNH/GDSL hydrolase family protein [Limnoraphis robusta]MEA5496276.1 SGNH/GDSL hydrolase family protein [Limnoraphis robusta BA-68 BA1]